MDTLYCEATCPPEEVFYVGSDDEDYDDEHQRRERYEKAGQLFLTGKVPFLLSASLQGPFGKESGWINPWTSKRQPTSSNSKAKRNHIEPIERRSKQLLDNAAKRKTISDSLECHLPSPQSLTQVSISEGHPFLEEDELEMVQAWRHNVENDHKLDAGLTPLSTVPSASAPKKRKPVGEGWLKTVATKRLKSRGLSKKTPNAISTDVAHQNQSLGSFGFKLSKPAIKPPAADPGADGTKSAFREPASQLISPPKKTPSKKRNIVRDLDVQPDGEDTAAVELSSPVSLQDPKPAPENVQAQSPQDENHSCSSLAQLAFAAHSKALHLAAEDAGKTDPKDLSEQAQLVQHDDSFAVKVARDNTTMDKGISGVEHISALSSSKQEGTIVSASDPELQASGRMDAADASMDKPSEGNTRLFVEPTEMPNSMETSIPATAVQDAPANSVASLADPNIDDSHGHQDDAERDTPYQSSRDQEMIDAPSLQISTRPNEQTIPSSPLSSLADTLPSEPSWESDDARSDCAISEEAEATVDGAEVSTNCEDDDSGAYFTRGFDVEGLDGSTECDDQHSEPSATKQTKVEECTDDEVIIPSVEDEVVKEEAPEFSLRTVFQRLVPSSPWTKLSQLTYTENQHEKQEEKDDNSGSGHDDLGDEHDRSLDIPSPDPSRQLFAELNSQGMPVEKSMLADAASICVPEAQLEEEEITQDCAPSIEQSDQPLPTAAEEPHESSQSEAASELHEPAQHEVASDYQASTPVAQDVAVSISQQSPWHVELNDQQQTHEQDQDQAQEQVQDVENELEPAKDLSIHDGATSTAIASSLQSPWAPEQITPVPRKELPVTTPDTPCPATQDAALTNNSEQDSGKGNEASVARVSTPEPQFAFKPFASFMTPSPERFRVSKRRSGFRTSLRHPHVKGILACNNYGPGESRPSKHVTWAVLPNETEEPRQANVADQASNDRQASPPPAAPLAELPTSADSKFSAHFSAVAKRTDGLRHCSQVTEDREEQGSSWEMDNQANVLANSAVEVDMQDAGARVNDYEDRKRNREATQSEEPMDMVEDMLGEMGDFWQPWDVETELNQSKKVNSMAAPQLAIGSENPW
ncbi:hypothetical protein K4F52_006048 [Lecanicillium sp. MT-2017a]|nr:hypothetical protein K4F52_006048 [Lecanicillium sp. MT-2017a]